MGEKDYRRKLKDQLIIYRKKLNLPKNLTFGIEIEYENISYEIVNYLLNEENFYNHNLNKWSNFPEIDIQECNNVGDIMNGEIVSPILSDTIGNWKKIEIVLDILKNNQAIVTNKCGGHVNIGIDILEHNIEYFKNFQLLWILYSKQIKSFSTGEYEKIRGNLELVKSLNGLLKVKDVIYLNTLSDMCPLLFDKRHEIYIEDNEYSKRIEFRIPNGTLSKEIWQNYINFFAKFVLACKKKLDREEILYKIKNNKGNVFDLANYIFDNELDKEFFLIQTLKTNKIYKKELPKHIIYTDSYINI